MPASEPVPLLVREVVGRFARQLRERFGEAVLDVRLYGSCARGEASETSDVDVFVLLERAAPAERRAVLDLAGDLWVESGLLLSPLVMGRALFEAWRTQDRALLRAIENEGIPA